MLKTRYFSSIMSSISLLVCVELGSDSRRFVMGIGMLSNVFFEI
jgi:hypothetical protein